MTASAKSVSRVFRKSLSKFRGSAPQLILSLILSLIIASSLAAANPDQSPSPGAQNIATKSGPVRAKYRLDLTIDFDHGSYTGIERLRWTNRGERPTSVLFFHLYSNIRSELQPTAPPANATDMPGAPDEPRIEVTEVRSVTNDAPL